MLSGPSPGRPASPLFELQCVHECVPVYVCHLANLSQSLGSDKNAAALRGHTLEWNEVRGAYMVRPNLQGGGYRDTQHSSKPGPEIKRAQEVVCMCVCREGVVEEVRGEAGEGETQTRVSRQ